MKPRNSRPRQEADGTRAERPADEGARLPFPDDSSSSAPGANEGAEGGGKRRRRRRRHGETGPELFSPDKGGEPQPPKTADTNAEAGQGERSGRRRRRRRRDGAEAKTPEGGQQTAAKPGPEEQARRREPRESGRRHQDREARPESRPKPRVEGGRRRYEGEERGERQGQRGHFAPKPPRIEERVPVFGGDDDEIELPPGIAGFDAEGRPIFSKHGRPSNKKPVSPVRTLESLSPSAAALGLLELLEEALDEAAPLQPKHRAALRGDIRRLWEDLTSDREHRPAEYLGSPAAMSAYLRYFLPWNVYRLVSLLSNADFCLPDRAVVVDIGAGPLTFVISLWIARPELREVPLTVYCLDRVERVMETGQAIFETLCLRSGNQVPPWKLELRRESFGAPLPERAHLLAAANVFNEFFWRDKASIGDKAIEISRGLLSYLRQDGSLFVMEPGDPRSGAFISALRAGLIAEGASPLGPCPHAFSCPFPGIFRGLAPHEPRRQHVRGDPNVAPSRYHLHPVVMPKKRDKFPWCHFGIDTDRAPDWLRARSEEAGLPKERAVLSYLWAARGVLARPLAAPQSEHQPSEKERRARALNHGLLVRVVSEPFALSDGSTGQYGCSNLGYSLLRRPRDAEPFEPGDLLEVQASPLQRNDEKSGAIILPT